MTLSPPTTSDVRAAVAVLVRAIAQARRWERGDRFATPDEMDAIIDAPLDYVSTVDLLRVLGEAERGTIERRNAP